MGLAEAFATGRSLSGLSHHNVPGAVDSEDVSSPVALNLT